MISDIAVEVTMTDGSRWIVYYRVTGSYADAVQYLARDISESRVMPAEDVDRVQRRHSLINAAHIVSMREAEQRGPAGNAPTTPADE